MRNALSKKAKFGIIVFTVIVFIVAVNQFSWGRRVFYPDWLRHAVYTLIDRDEIFSVEPYKNGTIILVKPVATGVGEGRYEAGDIVEIRDGQELYEQFGSDKDFLGAKEKTKLLPLYYDGKISKEVREELLKPEAEVDSLEGDEKDRLITKRRKIGIDYTKFLSFGDIRDARNEKRALNRLPEVDLSEFIKKSDDQLSVVEISSTLAKVESFSKFAKKVARKIIPPAFAQTTSESIVDPDNDTGTDYTTLVAWESGEQADLTSTNEIALASCRNTDGSSLDQTSFTVTGWTTDSTRYIKISVMEDYRHNGAWSETKFRIYHTGWASGMHLEEGNVKIEYIQFEFADEDSSDPIITFREASAIYHVSHSIFRRTTSTTVAGGGLEVPHDVTAYIWNNVIYGDNGKLQTGVDGGWTSGAETYAYNNTVYGATDGYIARGGGGTVYAKNNIAQNCTDGFDGTFTSSDYNLSDIASDAPSTSYRNGLATFVDFADADNGDFHLLEGTYASDVGTDLSSDPNLDFNNDVDGNSRPYHSTWDIGADERNCPDKWWSCQWQYRRMVTLDNSGQASNLTDFPAGVHLNSSRVDYSSTQNNGQDIRFVDGSGSTSTLQYEIEQWNESGTSTIWVKVPQLNSGDELEHVWMYYGNTYATTTATTTGVWDDNFVAVHHLQEPVNTTSDGYVDSTKYGNHGTGVSMALTEADGIAGKAQDLDGTADFIYLDDTADLRAGTGPHTREAWFNVPNSSQYGTVIDKNDCSVGRTPATNFGISASDLQTAGDSIAAFYGTNNSTTYEDWWPNNDVTDLTWHHVAQTISSSNGTLYLDSNTVSKRTNLGTPDDNNTDPLNIGAYNTISCLRQGFLDGLVDEVRISKVARSEDWLDFTYCNIKDTCNLYSDQQSVDGVIATGGATNSGNGTAISVTHGLSIYEGDLILAFIYHDTTGVGITDNNGAYTFTQEYNETEPGTSSGEFYIFKRTAGSSEPSSFSFTADQSQEWTIQVRVFAGADTSSIWDVTPSASTRDNADSGTVATAPTMTTSVDGTMGIYLKYTDGSAITHTDVTNGYNDEVENTTGKSIVTYTRTWASAGATGSTAATMSEGNDWTAHQWALTPASANSYPTITSVSDDGPVNAGSAITFTVDWNDADAGDLARSFVCQTDAFASSTLTCSGGYWASTTSFATTDPALPTYTTQGSDFGTNNYYVFVCDDDNYCSNSDSGTFTVNAADIYRSVEPSETSPVATSTGSITLSISGATATFSSGVPNDVGVGDVIQYDSDDNSSLDSLAFIHGRGGSTSFTVKDVVGDTATSTSATDLDWEIYRAYTSLSNAETGTENTGIQANMRDFDTWSGGYDISTSTGIGGIWNIALYASSTQADTAVATINGWTTDSDAYLRIYTPTSTSEVGTTQRHDGRWTTSGYRLINAGYDAALYFYQSTCIGSAGKVVVDGLQIDNTRSTDGAGGGIRFECGKYNTVSNTIFRQTGDLEANETYGIGGSGVASSTSYFYNNIIYDFHRGIDWGFGNNNGLVALYNNTIMDSSQYGLRLTEYDGTVSYYMKNNLIQNSTTGDYDLTGGETTSYLTNLASDTTSPNDALDSKDVTFYSEGSNNFHLGETDTEAMNNGTDLSGDSIWPFNTDIDSGSRSGTWDIGADEYSDTVRTNIKGGFFIKGGVNIKQ